MPPVVEIFRDLVLLRRGPQDLPYSTQLLAVLAGLYLWTRISHTALFWAAFILTRPLGAVVGDFLDKPHEEGGLELSRFVASAILLAFVVACISVFPQRAARRTDTSSN